jgi:hypothetical protein
MTDPGQQQQQAQNALAIQPPDPEAAAQYLKLVIEQSFKDAHATVRQALYALAIANFTSFDRFASEYAQVVGKLAKSDLAALNERIDEFPYDNVQEPPESVGEYLARKRIIGNKEVTTLAAIVYEMGGTISPAPKEVDGHTVPWFRAILTYRNVEYYGEGAKKQVAARTLFANNEPIRGIPASRSYEEPVADDPLAKQQANLYFQRIGKAVVVNATVGANGTWDAAGNIGDVRTTISGERGKNGAKRRCTYALYNAYKRAKNVPDADYPYIAGEPNAPGDDMEE